MTAHLPCWDSWLSKKWGLPAPGVSVGAIGVTASHRGHGYGQQLMMVAQEQAILAAHAAGSDVAEVRLRSLASAVGFYERLGFERFEEDPKAEKGKDTGAGTRNPSCRDPEAMHARDCEDEDAPCVPMVLRCAVSTPLIGPGAFPSPMADPWSPKRSRAFEDGPTWPPMMRQKTPMSNLLLPSPACTRQCTPQVQSK